MKSWLEKSDIEMYSMHNEGKSVFAEKFIRTLKIKLINTWLNIKEWNIDKLDDVVNKSKNIEQLKWNDLM